jgi:hypothetical protein
MLEKGRPKRTGVYRTTSVTLTPIADEQLSEIIFLVRNDCNYAISSQSDIICYAINVAVEVLRKKLRPVVVEVESEQ